ncbi:hypothetical protein DPMN_047282 [Dreissena polymorpha]|uniref:Uncharacterized protein n=1 Tax=Dreissena polymorpha TaxID=45954 RepID=A0A9D4I2Z6_DREPO|nr:hypothetical protein DPMN_047282 [Dreissena polymorpha]
MDMVSALRPGGNGIDRPRDRSTNMYKAIYPLFFEEGHKSENKCISMLLSSRLERNT